jgi:mRNA interferase RelE/StbE
VSFSLVFHPDVAGDIASLNATMKERLKAAISGRLTTEPTLYGKPLRATLKGYWKLRVGDYRVVFCINKNEVIIYAICHRKEVYDLIQGRIKA